MGLIKILFVVGLVCVIVLLAGNNTEASASINDTNIVDISHLEGVGGTDYIVPHQHYWDSYFSVYNDGRVSYNVYQYSYTGNYPDAYKNSFVGVLAPDEVITLNSNASYRFYADYDDVQDFGDIEKIEKKFNQWWFVIVVILMLLIAALYIYKVVKK